MRVSICGIQNESDLQKVVQSDADAAGFLVGQIHQSARFILPSTAGRLAAQLPPFISPVLITHLNTVDEIAEIIDKSNIKCVQLHGKITFEEIIKLRERFSETLQIILATYVVDNSIPDDLDEIYPFIDAILLDCFNREPAMIGSEENSQYMWAVGADFVRRCPLPVLLGGGLNSENVAEAIAKVKPYGIDACAGLRLPDSEECCLERCRNYVYNAKVAGFKISNG
ncbi:MAG: phosphoribosylanthranilate isomerase [Victivallaceae bacterium]|nr:phosphoribosylanthranilate isomerase [Victivallaceae bacterium]